MVLPAAVREEIRLAYDRKKTPCFRCGDRTDHYTKACDKGVKKAWKDAALFPHQADRDEAEQIYRALKQGGSLNAGSSSTPGSIPPRAGANTATQPFAPNTTAPVTGRSATSGGSTAQGTSSTVPGVIEYKYASLRNPDKLKAPDSAAGGVVREKCISEMQLLGSKPKPGAGEVLVAANYVQVTKIPDTLHVYSLSFKKPNPDPTKATIVYNRRRDIERCFDAMMQADVLKLKSDKGNIQLATDWKDFWTTEKIFESAEQEKDIGPFQFMESNGVVTDNMYVTVKYQRSLTDIRKKMRESELRDLPDYIRALNAIVAYSVDSKKGTNKEITHVGINKFFLNNGFGKTNSGLRLNRGYYSSIRPGQTGTLLNVNTATSAFLPPILVSDFVRGLNERSKEAKIKYAEKLLRGKQVRIIYERPEHKGKPNEDEARIKTFRNFGYVAAEQRFYKLDNNSGKKNREVSKEAPNGTTVLDFFKSNFKQPSPASAKGGNQVNTQKSVASDLLKIVEKDKGSQHDPEQLLCVNVGNGVRTERRSSEKPENLMKEQSEKGAVWIPACFLEILPNQVVTIPLQGSDTDEMINNAAHTPVQNVTYITEEGFDVLGLRIDSMGFQVDNKLIKLAARFLNKPTVAYKNTNGNMEAVNVGDASWNLAHRGHGGGLVQRTFVSAATPPITINFLYLRSNNQGPQNDLKQILKNHGLKISDKGKVEQEFSNNRNLESALNTRFSGDDLNLKNCSIIVLSQKDIEGYSIIKRTADIYHGRHTLCVLANNIKRPGGPLPSNLALKINMKFGGHNHYISNLRKDDVIVLGADVAHPGAGSRPGSPSIACVVGSTDSYLTNYPGSMRLQAGGQERIEEDHLKSMVKERLQAWKSQNPKKSLPSCMLFYRDGISESQFQDCKDLEIRAVKKAFEEVAKSEEGKDSEQGKGRELKVTFVICGKRHHTRFYATHKNDTTTSGNPHPGLLVQNIVTNPSPRNFFLQSHCAIKGTARPAHYHVLEDGMGLYKEEAGPLPGITNLLCYAFGRATKGVSYVAPAYIADRLCERGRAYLRAWNNGDIAGPLYQPPKDGEKVVRDEKRIRRYKNEYARLLMSTPEVWGPNYSQEPGKERLNPWHPNLDEVMFWL